MATQSHNTVTIDVLKAHFVCNFLTGELRHKHSKSGIRNSGIAGNVGPDGYRRIYCAGKTFAAHRVVWAMYYGVWPDNILDHKDGDRGDNSIANLRLADPVNNARNNCKRKNSSSRLKGACWNKSVGKWQSQIKYAGKNYYLGIFETEQEAHRAYAVKAKQLFGEFARVA